MLSKALLFALSIILFLVFIGLCITVIHLNYKVKYIEELAIMQNNYDNDIADNYETKIYSGEDDQPHSNEFDQPDSDSVEDDNSDQEMLGIHLTGKASSQSIAKDIEGPSFEEITNWQDAKKSRRNRRLQLDENDATIKVDKDGYYMIYAQLTWRMSQGVATFDIVKKNQNAPVSLAKCTTNFHDDSGAAMKTCYTSTAAELKRGDSLEVAVKTDDFTIDYNNGRSFFGAVALDQNHDG